MSKLARTSNPNRATPGNEFPATLLDSICVPWFLHYCLFLCLRQRVESEHVVMNPFL